MIKKGAPIEVVNFDLVPEQEAEIASNIAVSAVVGSTVATNLGLTPNTLQGKRVLDVASGCSDFVHWSTGHGALAYGVDIGYSDSITTITEKATQFNERTFSENLSPFAREMERTKVQGFANEMAEPIAIFKDDRIINPNHYIAGSATALPFERKTFDIVTSHSFLTSDAGKEREFTIACVLEALRVLRPQGTLHIGHLLLDPRMYGKDFLVETRQIGANIEAAGRVAQQRRVAKKLSKFTLPNSDQYFIITKAR